MSAGYVPAGMEDAVLALLALPDDKRRMVAQIATMMGEAA